MPQVYVINRAGQEIALDTHPGTSLMQAITEGGVDDLLALCGGVCSCATCHVYVDGDTVSTLPAMDEDERGLLEMSSHRRDNSRLSCQIRLTEGHEGLRATIAPGD